MFALVVAGEAIFALPFHLTRFFRPTVLEVFNLTATELGAAQAAYGIFAMLAYFPGGPIADRFPANRLMAGSLFATALGGLYLATFPDYRGALLLWGFFGVSTILLFWAAMIRATREWGGSLSQGLAYGLLDGGRGVLAAALASVGVWLLSLAFPDGANAASLAEKKAVLHTIILGYTAVTAGAGVLVLWVVRSSSQPVVRASAPQTVASFSPGLKIVYALQLPSVWMQATIVLCAYVGYKGFDNYSLYAVQAYGMDEVEAAGIVALGAWARPIAAIGAGILGDRLGASRVLVVLFTLLLGSNLYLTVHTPTPSALWTLLGNTLITCIAIFGFRGLYFALFEEARVPLAVTGTAVGIVSVIGYLPDVFVTLVAGILIDRTPGLMGHQHFFAFLSAFALAGLVASVLFARVCAKPKHAPAAD